MTENSQSRRLTVNKIFGEYLPETTTDEWDDEPTDGGRERDDWLRDNVPPHHG